MEIDFYSNLSVTIDPEGLREKYSLGDNFSGVLKIEPFKRLDIAIVELNLKCTVGGNKFNGCSTTFGCKTYGQLRGSQEFRQRFDYHGCGRNITESSSIYIPIRIEKFTQDNPVYSDSITTGPLEVFAGSTYSGLFPIITLVPIIIPIDDLFLSASYIWNRSPGEHNKIHNVDFLPSMVSERTLDIVMPQRYFFTFSKYRMKPSEDEKPPSSMMPKTFSKLFRENKKQNYRGVLLEVVPQLEENIRERGSTIEELNLEVSSLIDSSEPRQNWQVTKAAVFYITKFKISLISETYIRRNNNDVRVLTREMKLLENLHPDIVLDMAKFTNSGEYGDKFDTVFNMIAGTPIMIPINTFPDICCEDEEFKRSHQFCVEVHIMGERLISHDFRFTKDTILVEGKYKLEAAHEKEEQLPSYIEATAAK